jgi:hypothetical protein
MPRYGSVSKDRKVDLSRDTPYNFEQSTGIQAMHIIFEKVAISVVFDEHSCCELQPNLLEYLIC